MAKGKGVSRTVRVKSGGGRTLGSRPSQIDMNMQAMARERAKIRERYTLNTAGLSAASKQALDELAGTSTDKDTWDNHDGMNVDDAGFEDVDDAHRMGSESYDNVGQTFAVHVRDLLGNRWHGRRYRKDARTWKRRVRALDDNWNPILDPMTDAYITWKYTDSPNSPMRPSSDPQYSFTITTLDIYSLEKSAFIPRDEDTEASVALVRAGYLGNSPQNPSLAISLRTLDLFYTIRLFKPSFSIEAFSKVLCHVYQQPYRRGYRTSLSDIFDIYLTMRRILDKRVAKEMSHDTPNYRVLNACPACCYKLNDEPDLKFSRMWIIDGNNSLKRIKGIAGRMISDTRVFTDSDYYIPTEEVDKYANEVKSRSREHEDTDDSDDEDGPFDTSEGDPTDGPEDAELKKVLHGCTERWKASAKDSNKKMWAIFKESGIFASACRHGFILWLVDMIESGELAKYPLAMVGKALDTFEDQWVLGYDIGCRFSSTISSSSLGARFQAKRCRTCVNAFHGCTHNILCQHQNLPLNIEGMGLEDLETMERIFSSSNQLAPLTRYMSGYRRRVFIDMYFRQWDADKYQGLAQMLHNNYVQAQKIIEEDGAAVKQALADLNLTEQDLEAFFQQEVSHFREKLGTEVEENVHAVAYVELLQKYRDLNTAYQNLSTRFRSQIPQDYQPSQLTFQTQIPQDFEPLSSEQQYNAALSQTRKTETDRRVVREQRDKILHELVEMEVSMGIEHRWTPASPEYINAMKYMSIRKYQQALETLYKLIIQRLFEMHRLNLNQTGYKMRTHIAQALQKRSKAIRTAVRRYNEAAVALDPPRSTLDWSKVSHYTFLDQFEVLRETRHNVFNQPWAQPIIRETMKRHRRVTRAHEEINRCNIELRRLHTSIVDEGQRFKAILQQLCSSHSPNYGPVQEYITRRQGANRLLMEQLKRTFSLPNFSGSSVPGTRSGPPTSDIVSDTAHLASCPPQQEPTQNNVRASETTVAASSDNNLTPDGTKADDEDYDSVDEDDDEFTQTAGALTDFLSNLSVYD